MNPHIGHPSAACDGAGRISQNEDFRELAKSSHMLYYVGAEFGELKSR